ncbi:MAG: ABC transporter substrate binding protein [Sedimenticola sp.]
MLWTFLLLAGVESVCADEVRVMIVKSGEASIYSKLSDTVENELNIACLEKPVPACRGFKLKVASIEDPDLDMQLHGFSSNDLVITAGRKAAQWLHMKRRAHSHSAQAIYSLIPQATYREIATTDSKSSAVFLDQPFDRLIRFSKLITPSHPYIGVLLGPSTKQYEEELKASATRHGVPIEFEIAESSDKIGGQLRKLLSNVNLLLGLPDPEIYNRKNVVGILLSSYHNQVPVLGFSAAYVKAGALAAVYSTPEDIGRQLAETIKEFLDSGGKRLPPPRFPSYFNISTNETVAKSLGLTLMNKELLRALLMKEEEK